MDKRCRAPDTRHKASAERTRSRDSDTGPAIHYGSSDTEMAGIQPYMGLSARVCLRRWLCMRRCAAQQMYEYKTASKPSKQGMSHTILKPQQASHGNTLLNEVTGTFEVYWEQLKRSAKDKWKGNQDKNTNSTGYEEASYNSDEETTHRSRRNSRADTKTKFIEANVVFGQ